MVGIQSFHFDGKNLKLKVKEKRKFRIGVLGLSLELDISTAPVYILSRHYFIKFVRRPYSELCLKSNYIRFTCLFTHTFTIYHHFGQFHFL